MFTNSCLNFGKSYDETARKNTIFKIAKEKKEEANFLVIEVVAINFLFINCSI